MYLKKNKKKATLPILFFKKKINILIYIFIKSDMYRVFIGTGVVT